MRILLISESLSAPGGWATYARNLTAGLKGLKHDVAIWSPEHPGEFPALPPPIAALSHPFRTLLLSWRLRAVLRQFSPEIIHVTTEPYVLLLALLPRKMLARSVLTIHGSYGVRILHGYLRRLIMKRILARIPAFVAVSEYTKRRVADEIVHRLSPDLAQRFLSRTRVIYNAIEFPTSEGKRDMTNTVKQILLVGPVKPRKGILEAIEACAAYQKISSTPFVLRIIGTVDEDVYVQAVKQKINECHLENSVRFEGVLTQERLEEAYHSADLLLLPARTTETTFEGFGLTYIEAASHGVPVIGPDCSGAAEAIGEGRSGYRVPPSDAQKVAEHMRLILDEQRIAPETCRAWAAQFSIDRMAQAISGLYKSIRSPAL